VTINKAFIEELGSRRMESEMCDVYDELCHRNIPVELFTDKRLHRRQLPVAKDTLVVGYVETMYTVFKLLGIQPPSPNDYPSVLQPLFHRRIWNSSLQELMNSVTESGTPIFAKPSKQRKLFTGQVFKHSADLNNIDHAPMTTPIFCSEVIDWLSEYRVFVIHGSIVGAKHYDGDSAVKIDEQVAIEAVRLLEKSDDTTAAYAIDLGVIPNGQTALIEWNDGFSLGSYGLDRSVYTDLLIARWNELMDCHDEVEHDPSTL
jgi:hypothetical protein